MTIDDQVEWFNEKEDMQIISEKIGYLVNTYRNTGSNKPPKHDMRGFRGICFDNRTQRV